MSEQLRRITFMVLLLYGLLLMFDLYYEHREAELGQMQEGTIVLETFANQLHFMMERLKGRNGVYCISKEERSRGKIKFVHASSSGPIY